MPVDLSLYCDNHIEWDYTTTNDVSGITIDNSGISTLEYKPNNYVTIGNPPFGKRSKLAIDFFVIDML